MSVVPFGFAGGQVRDFNPPNVTGIQSHGTASVIPDEFVVLDGVPIKPKLWTRAEVEVSAKGEFYGERPSIYDINEDALVRFVPTSETWDEIGFVWNPLVSETAGRYQMDGSPLSSPFLSDSEYQIGKELFTTPSLDFGVGDLLTSQFNEDFDDAYSFTLAMAINVKEIGTEKLLSFLDGSYLKLTETGLEAKVDGKKFSVTIPQGPRNLSPLYIILEVTPPVATVVAAWSPTKLYLGTSAVSTRTTSFVFSLMGEMEIYGMDIWGDIKPTYTEIVGRYASVMGANR